MEQNEILKKIGSCIGCEGCLDVCDTYLATGNILKSPKGRLEIAGKVFNNKAISEEDITAIYTCTLCSMCDQFCQKEIPISEIILNTKFRLVEKGLGPLTIHKTIIEGILEKSNSVNGNLEERLNWLPSNLLKEEEFEAKNSDTLLFLGCMSSFRVKESATASYELLKKANFDFKIIKQEPCCGEYIYSSGDLELAKTLFKENFEMFQRMGVKTIITTCGGCLYAFNNVYPKYIPSWNIKVKHVIQVIHELYKEKRLNFKKNQKEAFYYDPCRTGRKLNGVEIYEEPRELLKACSSKIHELSKNREFTPCCGAGSGVRGVDSSISINIGERILNECNNLELITSCPLCVFNYRYVDYKKQLNKKIKYITDYLLEALD